jgi:hypothetical protein
LIRNLEGLDAEISSRAHDKQARNLNYPLGGGYQKGYSGGILGSDARKNRSGVGSSPARTVYACRSAAELNPNLTTGSARVDIPVYECRENVTSR